MKSRRTVELGESFRERWLSYTASAGAAGVGLLATAQPAWADIIYTPADIPLPGFLDVNNSGVVDFVFSGFTTLGVGPRGSYLTFKLQAFGYHFGLGDKENGFADHALPLHRGAFIGPGDTFTGTAGFLVSVQYINLFGGGTLRYLKGPWANVIGYLGLEFQIDGQTHFGWAQLDSGGLITGYAYNTVTDQSLIAGQGQAPEPGTLGLLALGSLGLGFWRRRKAVGGPQ